MRTYRDNIHMKIKNRIALAFIIAGFASFKRALRANPNDPAANTAFYIWCAICALYVMALVAYVGKQIFDSSAQSNTESKVNSKTSIFSLENGEQYTSYGSTARRKPLIRSESGTDNFEKENQPFLDDFDSYTL